MRQALCCGCAVKRGRIEEGSNRKSENGIIFPADSSGKPIVDDDRAAMQDSPIYRTAQVGDEQIVLAGDVFKII